MPVRGSGVLACSSSLLLYGHLGRCQAETPLIQLSKFVRPALTIEEALQDRRHVKPPLRKDENELLGQPEPGDIAGDGPAIIGRREIAATLGAGKARIEVVSVKINHVDLDTATLERRADVCGGGLGESVIERVGDDQKRTQGRPLRILPFLSA